jgi:hypothetical protein
MNIFCKICNSQTTYGIETFAKYHLKKIHGLTSKEYYDQTKQYNEGLCKVCGNPTFFRNINEGYNIFCSNKCAVSDSEQLKMNIEKSREAQRKKYNGKLFFETKEGQKKVQKNVKKKYGTKSCFGNAYIKDKIQTTNIKKYGVANPFKSKTIQQTALQNKIKIYGNGCNIEKHKETCLKKYGVDNFNKTRRFRRYMESIGKWVSLKTLTKFEKYRRAVNKETRKNKKNLFALWNGLCYYTNKKLITLNEWKEMNTNLSPSRNSLHPTIDHKVSIINGFVNNISPEIIGGMDNLCICARYVNTKKNYKNFYGFN